MKPFKTNITVDNIYNYLYDNKYMAEIPSKLKQAFHNNTSKVSIEWLVENLNIYNVLYIINACVKGNFFTNSHLLRNLQALEREFMEYTLFLSGKKALMEEFIGISNYSILIMLLREYSYRPENDREMKELLPKQKEIVLKYFV